VHIDREGGRRTPGGGEALHLIMEDDDQRSNEPSAAMVEHLAKRLVDRYGRDAPAEAEQIVRLLRADGNEEQAQVWSKVGVACQRMVTKPGATARKPE
jgi:hypothetical protein